MKNFLSRLVRFHSPEGDAGAGGAGEGDGDAGAAGGNGAGGGAPPAFDIRQHLDDAGKFKPGWSKAAGIPDTLEAKFSEPAALARSYASLEKQIGAKGVIIPGPNASQQERDAYYNALGRPAKPEDYAFSKPDKVGDRVVPDAAWDKTRAANWEKRLHAIGVSKDQAHKIMEASITESLDGMEMINKGYAQTQAAAKAQLIKDAGGQDGFDKMIGSARRVAEEIGGDELLNHPGLGNDPVMIKALAKVATMIGERPGAGIRQQAGESRLSPADAKAEGHKLTGEMAQRLKADRNFKNTPEYAQMAERKTSLFKVAFPEG